MNIEMEWTDYEFLVKARVLEQAPEEGLAPEDICWGNLSELFFLGTTPYDAVEKVIGLSTVSEVKERGKGRLLRCRNCNHAYTFEHDECPECGSSELFRRGDEAVLYHGKVEPPERGVVIRVEKEQYDEFCFVCFDDGKHKPYVLRYACRSLLRPEDVP